jgi:hypothetical protein
MEQKLKYRLKNLFTGVSAPRTIAEIEIMLGEMGANQILKEMDGGIIQSVSFTIRLKGKNIPYQLPMNIEKARGIIDLMANNRIIPMKFAQEPYRTERAQMVGWRIIKDWLYAQLSLFKMELVDPIQIFLPYLWDEKNQKTLGQHFSETGMKALIHTLDK